MGLNGKLFLVAFLLFSKLSVLQNIPLNCLFLPSIRWKKYLSTNAFRTLTKMRYLVLKIISPSCFSFIMGIFVPSYIYLVYGKQDAKGKLLMAIFSPLIGVVLEVICDLSTMRPAVMVHNSSRIFVRLVSAVVIWISVYISSVASRPWEHQVFCYSWHGLWCCRSHKEKHYGFHRSHFPCNFTKKINPLGNFSHSSAGETNEWYRYFKHALWINCYRVC